jgi:cellulose biosynthesis protein BcsQ
VYPYLLCLTSKICAEHYCLATLDYPVFTTYLHLYVAYREAAATGQSVLEYDRHSKAAAEFAAFFAEVLEVTPDA